jgi:hypothetical protein
MADANIKQISLSGNAAEDYKQHTSGNRKRRGGGRTRKNRDDTENQFGGDVPMGPELRLTQVNTNRAANLSKQMNFTKIGGSTSSSIGGGGVIDQTTGRQPAVQLPIVSTPANTSAGHVARNPEALKTLPAVAAQLNAGTAPVSNGGGKKQSRVVLAPKKHKSSLLLAPPMGQKKSITKVVNKTRKIKVQLANMKKRVTTAKIIHKDSKEKSIEEIRRLLEDAKLVKPVKDGKKVPEDILRNIYKDYLILRNKAL